MEPEQGMQPLAAVLAAVVAGALAFVWRELGDVQWPPVVLYVAVAGVGAWWCHTRLGPRATAAFIVAAAVMVGLLLPFGWLALTPPE